MKKEVGNMKISRLVLFISLLFIFLILYECKADWKKDLTDLGFYAIIDGTAYLLEFKNLGKGDTYCKLFKSEFGEIPTIKKPSNMPAIKLEAGVSIRPRRIPDTRAICAATHRYGKYFFWFSVLILDLMIILYLVV